MRRLIVLALVLAAPAVRAAPEAPPELSALVPADTFLLVEGNDLDGNGYGPDTAIGKLLAEPEVRRFVTKLAESLRAAYGGNARGPLAMFGLAPEDLDGIKLRRFGLAVVTVAIETRQVDAIVYLDVREGQDKVARILRGLRQAAETFLAAQFKEEVVRGRTVISTEAEGHELCVAAQGGQFVLTTRRARMDDVLRAMDEGHQAALSSSTRVTRLKERMGAERNAIFAYADAPALGRLALDALRYEGGGDPENLETVARALGLDAVEALGFADIPLEAGYRIEGAILLKERRGLFALASNAPPTHRFAAMTPQDALAYGGETCDLVALWDGILAIAGGIGADLRAKLERGVREGGAVLGIDVRNDLLAALGTEWAGYVAWPPGGGLLPDVALFATVRDRARLEKTLDALAAKVRELRGRGATVTSGSTEFRGHVIRFLEITDKRGEPRPYAPAWAFGEDFVVFGLCPQTVKHALMEKEYYVGDSGGAPGAGPPRGLSGRTDFQRLLAAVPKSTVSATYLDLGRVLTCLYGTGVPLLQVTQGAANRQLQVVGLRLNFEDLPTADVLARHLSGMVCYTAVEDDCLRFGCVSQIGAPLAVAPVAFLAGLAVVLIPRSQAAHAIEEAREREEARRAAAEAAAKARREQEAQALRAENEALKKRLEELEAKVAELLRETEEKDK
ncbi:MAG TPA: hypothetical protein VFY93_08785 [Planctomycetota bacterium]|nr:hypothetical protein [Planctomycetota bacterium]